MIGVICNDQISIHSALFDQHKARYGSILIQINKAIQVQSFINRYNQRQSHCNCTLQTGGRTHVTTAFGDRVKFATGVTKQSRQRNEWLMMSVGAVYWVNSLAAFKPASFAVMGVFRRCYQS